MPETTNEGLKIKLQNVALWAMGLGLFLLLANQLLEGAPILKKIPLLDNLSNEIGFALLIAAILIFTTKKMIQRGV